MTNEPKQTYEIITRNKRYGFLNRYVSELEAVSDSQYHAEPDIRQKLHELVESLIDSNDEEILEVRESEYTILN